MPRLYKKRYAPRKSIAKAKYHLRAARYHSRKGSFSRYKPKRRFGRRRLF